MPGGLLPFKLTDCLRAQHASVVAFVNKIFRTLEVHNPEVLMFCGCFRPADAGPSQKAELIVYASVIRHLNTCVRKKPLASVNRKFPAASVAPSCITINSPR